MYHALIWLLVIEILGLIALPIAFTLFRRLPDRGLAFSKILALLLSSYALWILGTSHILPNSQYTIIGILAVLGVASSLIVRRKFSEIIAFVREERPSLIAAEAVFLAFYFLWLMVVSFSPAIKHTEKPMDFAFLNSILQSTHFPPEDPWLSGHSISYYYFGHFMMALLTKLTTIPSSVSYNLSIALIPALMAAGAFSLVYNLIRLSGAKVKTAVVFALAAPALLALVGNLEGVLEFVHARGWGSGGFWEWVSIKGLEDAQMGDASFFPRQYLWWWHATRLIDTVEGGISLDYTITEFPFFSFLLGDLHAHVIALPFLVFTFALGLNMFVSGDKLGAGWLKQHPWESLAIALSLGSLAFINAWDFPVFATLFGALVLVKAYSDWDRHVPRSLINSLVFLVPVVATAVVLYIPFYLTFSSQAAGISAAGDTMRTRPLFFFMIWGLLVVLAGSFLLRQLPSVPGLGGRNPGLISVILVITLLPFLIWAGSELLVLWTGWDYLVNQLGGDAIGGASTVGTRFGKLLPALAIIGIGIYSAVLRSRNSADKATAFALLSLALAFFLLVGAELFYLLDLFGNRMNTVFKVYYQAWVLLAIVSVYGLYYCSSRPLPSMTPLATPLRTRLKVPARLSESILRASLRYGWTGLIAVLLVASIYYPIGAALDRVKNSGGGNSLDGLEFLHPNHSDEYAAIKWLRDEAPHGRIVEAVGDDYSEYARISSSTGLPTLLGWKGHEHQWRGSTRPFDGREEQVAQIYQNNDPDQVVRLLETYDIRYVYAGPRERRKYGEDHVDRFSTFLEPVFRQKNVVIYERPQNSRIGVVEGENGDSG